jgi:hypothetical protein
MVQNVAWTAGLFDGRTGLDIADTQHHVTARMVHKEQFPCVPWFASEDEMLLYVCLNKIRFNTMTSVSNCSQYHILAVVYSRECK